MVEKAPESLIDLHLPKRDGPVVRAVRYVKQRWRRVTAVGAIAIGTIAVGGHMLGGVAGLWEFYRTFTAHGGPHADAGAKASAAATSTRPFRSLAVLPFKSGGSPEDVETAQKLSRDLTFSIRRVYRDMSIASTGVVQAYKANSPDARAIGQAANVRYVVEGSVERSASGSEVAIELIDTLDGSQVWADRISLVATRESGDPLARIRTRVRDAIVNSTRKELSSLPAKDRAAWELMLRSDDEDVSIEGYKRRQKLLEEALRIDPSFVPALRALSNALFQRIQDEPEQYALLVRALDDMSARAVRAAPDDLRVWMTRASALRVQGNMDGAFSANDNARRIEPSEAQVVMQRGAMLIYAGRPSDALVVISEALELDPSDSIMTSAVIWRCLALTNLRKHSEAAPLCEKAAGLWNRWIMYAFPASNFGNLGNQEKVKYWKGRLMQANPRASLKTLREVARVNSTAPEWIKQIEDWIDGLRKAGVPEK